MSGVNTMDAKHAAAVLAGQLLDSGKLQEVLVEAIKRMETQSLDEVDSDHDDDDDDDEEEEDL